jgi:hypothetical protein
MIHHISYTFKKDYHSVRMEILYDILIEAGVNVRRGRRIKMCLTKMYCRVFAR